MPRRENTFRVDYSQFPKHLSHDEIHKFVVKELGLTRDSVTQLQPSRRLGCTFVKVNKLELAEQIVEQHDGKHDFVFDGKSYKLRITMEDGAVEVRLFDLPEGVTNEHVATFLADYGDVINVRDLLWDNRYGELGGVTTGVRVARVVVTKNIPSLVTIQGEETAVAYRGQRQTCLHCHEFAHIGIPCVQNKKLLVQKLAADQSYANVAKGISPKPTTTKTATNPTRKPTTGANAVRVTGESSEIGASGSTANLLGEREILETCKQTKNTMPPPVAPATLKPPATEAVIQLTPTSMPTGTVTHRKSDGNETDNSQASLASNNSRRSRRQPPGKKMKHSANDFITTSKHGRNSDDEMQQ